MVFTLFFIGFWAQAQLSIVSVIGMVRAARGQGSLSFLLYDPPSLVLWAFTLATLIVWGRGTFCGWLCPFGAMQELAADFGRWLGIKPIRISDRWDARLKNLKYVALAAVLIAAAIPNAPAETVAEIEPFKTAITLVFVRELPFVIYAVGLVIGGMFAFKFFCRYLCPLGAAFALVGLLRRWRWLPSAHRMRRSLPVVQGEMPLQRHHQERRNGRIASVSNAWNAWSSTTTCTMRAAGAGGPAQGAAAPEEGDGMNGNKETGDQAAKPLTLTLSPQAGRGKPATGGLTRRAALAGAGLTAILGADAATGGRPFRRLAIAFNTTVAVTVVTEDAREAEAAFAAAFAEIRAVDRLSSLTRPDGDVVRLNRDGRLASPALTPLLETAALMHEATAGAFDVTIQPLWLAMDAAARRGRWLDAAELGHAQARVDQGALRFDERGVGFAKPGMAVTLNSLSRGLAADRVAAALARCGIARAMFDTDVLGARGARPDGGPWLASLRHPRLAQRSVAIAPVTGFLATSGDYQYFWSPDFSRNHIVDPRRGRSPGDFASVTVKASSGLMADALSTAAFLVGAEAAPALLARFGAEALFVGKDGAVTRTPGFDVVAG